MNEGGQTDFSYEDETEKMGFKDKDGKIIIPASWDWVGEFHEGLAVVSDNKDKWGCIDIQGNLVVPCIWDTCGFFSEGLAFVEKDGKFGYINKSGEVVIPLMWYGAYPFSNGLAKVNQKDGDVIFINKKNQIVSARTIDTSQHVTLEEFMKRTEYIEK